MTIENTLQERGDRYGKFEDHAVIAQELQDCMRSQRGWRRLAPDQKQALTVIADKIARMLNGDPAHRDNWHDIVGYAKLVDDRMARDEAAPKASKWIEHNGCGCPDILRGKFVHLKMESGFEDGPLAFSGYWMNKGNSFWWTPSTKNPDSIIAYRLAD